jgi:hypothetical protein
MTPERYHQVNQLFHEALERAGEDRDDFLKGACGDDESLRLAVERMLVAREQAGSFLNAPAFDAVADSLIQKHSGSLIGCVIGITGFSRSSAKAEWARFFWRWTQGLNATSR